MNEPSTSVGGMLLGYLEDFIRALANSLGIAEKLSKLAPEKRNKRILEEVLEPIHDRLLEVHTNYLRVFNWLSSQLPIAVSDNEWTDPNTREALDKREVQTQLQSLIQGFQEKADEFNGVRTQLRTNAESYIAEFEPGTPERGFVWAAIDYFLRREFANQSEERIVAMADMIADSGSHTMLSTPASGVLSRIAEEDDPTIIGQIVDLEKIELTKRYSDVSRCFYWARKELLKHR